MPADPGNVAYRMVTGRFARSVGDTSDPDRAPNYPPIPGGEVVFTASAPLLINRTADPDPLQILTDPIRCSSDDDGYLVDEQGNRGVNLPCSDDEDLNPGGFTWHVDFRGSLARRPGFSFHLPTVDEDGYDGPVDLAALSPVPSSGGQAIVVGPEGPRGPEGPQGEPGEEGPEGPPGPVDVPDTGAREISAEFTDAATATTAVIRRWGPVVVLNLTLELHTTTAGAELIQMPIGWRPQSTVFFTTDQLTRGNMNFAGRMRFWSNITGGSHNVTVQWFTGEAFPTTLPGTPL